MLYKLFKKQSKPESGYSVEESTEIWVADFGSHELEAELKEQIQMLKPKEEISFSWVLMSIALLLFATVTELILRQWGLMSFWPEATIFWATWFWRVILVLLWLSLARFKLVLDSFKLFVITFVAFISSVIIVGVVKIIYVQSVWAWLSLLVEPIWMALIIGIFGSLFIKLSKNKN